MFKEGATYEATKLLTEEVTERLHQVDFTAPTQPELDAIFLAAQLFIPDRLNKWSLLDKNQVVQKTCLVYENVRTNPDVVLLFKELQYFND